ncbi:ATP-binding protein [Phenylobacterium sp.]|uniref:sensor histidine kinase n=1 Tax=Phenylobacterium sp. TaxID=1871053 RepID=UPI0027300997|nr:ATP-binding protein [Phenylobacterium sp.]MDP1618427.1 DUF4118 domain-containing protein [Phenylobacterium sp.]MDP1987557.1 DUF4118 domain-containing protein [Phenylobacterium sp.]
MSDMISNWVRRRPRLVGYASAILVVLLANLLALIVAEGLGYVRVSMIFLGGVLVVAVLLGSGPAYLAAVLGFVSYNFYLVEPRFTFGVESEDIIILVVFLAVAMMTGGLAGRVRDDAIRAQERARTSGVLFQAGRDFAGMDEEAEIAQRLATGLAEAAQGQAVVLIDGRCFAAPDQDPPDTLIDALAALEAPGATSAKVGDWRLRNLWAEGRRLGAAAWRSDDEPDGAQLIHVLLDMGATSVARARLSRAWAEVEATDRTQSLRNALLSSISHDLRTPLASIQASASSLRAFGDTFDAEVRNDLLDTIQEEAERLNAFVGNLLNMTKLEAGALAIQGVTFEMAESLDRLVRRFERRRGGRMIAIRVEGDRLAAWGDPILFEQALANVLENALRFSPEQGTVEVSLQRRDDMLIVEVADEGPGVRADELARIFEKFYRSPSANTNLQGAGLGLSIVKGLIEAMGGKAIARNRDDRDGLVVALILPSAKS